jgi:DNA-binding response OmpR family regulator
MATRSLRHRPSRRRLGARLAHGLISHIARLSMGLQRPRVLIVSQDRASEVLADLLAVLDCDVEHSRAAGRAFQREYEVLVLDLDLPDTDPWRVATTLCRLGLDARRLILTSAAPTIVERNRADRVGAILLRKPLVLEEVTETLARVFTRLLPAETG